MKTIALILFTAISFTLSAAPGDSSCSEKDLNTMSNEISANARNWDFSGVKSDSATAIVFFRVTTDGTIAIEDVKSDNNEMSRIVYENLPGMEILNACENTSILYNVRVVYCKQ